MPQKPKMMKDMSPKAPKPKSASKIFLTPSGFFVAITVLILAFFPLLPRLLGGTSELMQWLLHIWRDIIRPIVIVLDILLAALFIFLLTKIFPMQTVPSMFHHRRKKEEKKKDAVVIAQWEAVLGKAATGKVESLRLAVIEADALVDVVLKGAGYEGENLAERLARVLPSEVKSVEGVWAAHRLRNDLVHTPGFVLTPEAAKAALDVYEAFLKEVEAI